MNMRNPDLLNPGETRASVPSLTKFRHKNEFGDIVESTKPFPNAVASEKKYYISTMPAASMHRSDGKKLAFVNGFLPTDLLYDQAYLDEEIAEGNPYVRYASEQEIERHLMALDPQGTMYKKAASEIAGELELEIRKRLAEKMGINIDEVPMLSSADKATSVEIGDGAQIEGNAGNGNGDNGAAAIAGVSAASDKKQALLDALKRGSAVRSSGLATGVGATVLTPVSTAQTPTAPISGA